ncbi:segregation and condensation protein A [Variibacter gotjawalensis]|nr:segregation and condensation protein A [Variibacter gotjawalensis]
MIVDVEGFEGPLDVLLALARQQKVDLAKISVLALAEQYLKFVEEARKAHLELAADYLVMAAWLAYLKSRLLIPQMDTPGDEPSAAELAAALAIRLQRLEAIRAAAVALMGRPQLGRDTFERGDPEPVNAIKRPEYSATLYDLLTAYSVQRRKTALSRVRFKPRDVWSLTDAREALKRLAGMKSYDWQRLDDYLIQYVVEPGMRASVLASSFAASLELVREGVLELHQSGSFQPIYLRAPRVGPRPVEDALPGEQERPGEEGNGGPDTSGNPVQ